MKLVEVVDDCVLIENQNFEKKLYVCTHFCQMKCLKRWTHDDDYDNDDDDEITWTDYIT